jgi:hypothetical protein
MLKLQLAQVADIFCGWVVGYLYAKRLLYDFFTLGLDGAR